MLFGLVADDYHEDAKDVELHDVHFHTASYSTSQHKWMQVAKLSLDKYSVCVCVCVCICKTIACAHLHLPCVDISVLLQVVRRDATPESGYRLNRNKKAPAYGAKHSPPGQKFQKSDDPPAAMDGTPFHQVVRSTLLQGTIFRNHKLLQ